MVRSTLNNPHGMIASSPAIFYLLVAIASLTCWLVMSIADKGDFHSRLSRYTIATRPTILPTFLFQQLHSIPYIYPILCHGLPFIFYFTSYNLNSKSIPYRLAAAIFITTYHLIESSKTASHRDYANMYTSWALALFPNNDEISQGIALGICILLIAGSGYAKLIVGGTSWMHSTSLSSILRTYSKYSLSECGPLFPSLNLLLRQHPSMSTGLSTLTILFECVLVPCCLFLPSKYRWIMILTSIGMHIGIAFSQSFIIGIAFLPNIATYCYGFGATSIDMNTKGWWVAMSMVFVWCIATYFRRSRLLSENWPLTPFALFAWNGKQWDSLFDRFKRGNTRLVVYNPTYLASNGLINEIVTPNCYTKKEFCNNKIKDDDGSSNIYNGWELLMGETFCHSIVLNHLGIDDNMYFSSKQFVTKISEWMNRSRRFISKDGIEMTNVAYVVLGKNKNGKGRRIEKVLADHVHSSR